MQLRKSTGFMEMTGRSSRFGNRFVSGFLDFYKSRDFTDVTIIAPNQEEYHLHKLILSYNSEFFRRAFSSESSEFKEKSESLLTLGFEDPSNVWPIIVEYMYTDEIHLTDEIVLPVFAMARQLMMSNLQAYCGEFAQGSLETSNAIRYLGQAVQFDCDVFKSNCVSLVAEHFSQNFYKATDGLPFEVILEILQHPGLEVQTEEQVLVFVLGYVRRHDLDKELVQQLFSHIKFAYLSNARLSELLGEALVPRALLLESMAQRLAALDHPERLVAAGHLPRKSYVCSVEYGLPGGSEYASLSLEFMWEDIVPLLSVSVSAEHIDGDTAAILNLSDDNCWCSISSDSPDMPVWIDITFPPYLRVVELHKFSFSHGVNFANHMFPYGISDQAWFQMKSLGLEVSGDECEPLVPLRTSHQSQEQMDYTITLDCHASSSGAKHAPWRRLRISPSADACDSARLSVRRLMMFGRVEVSLLRDQDGMDLLAMYRRRKESTAKYNSLNRSTALMAARMWSV